MSNVVHLKLLNPPPRLGRYRLIAKLGEGGMGTIHLAVAGGLGGFRKLFVLKELKRELTHNEQFLELFIREARLAARLNHANVVHTVEADHDDGRYFLAMEFLDGQPFNEILRRAEQPPAVPLSLRLQVICHALAGLHHAHELIDYDGKALRVVHRDVSPANIFLTYDGQVKMLDFGIAKAGDAESTQPRAFKGKIGYAAPEQLKLLPPDRRTDVFAAGVVLWEAIALRHFVRGKPTREVFQARLMGTEPRIGQLVPNVHPKLAAICARAMCPDPEQRYASAEAFRRELQAYLLEHEMFVEATTMSEFMRSKFAAERSAMHAVLEAQLRGEVEPDSVVTQRSTPSLSPPEQRKEIQSLLAPLATADDDPSSWPAPEASKTGPRSRLAIGFALLAMAGAYAWRVQTGHDERVEGDKPVEREAAPSVASAPITAEAPIEAPAAQEAVEMPSEPAAAQPPVSPAAPELRPDAGSTQPAGAPARSRTVAAPKPPVTRAAVRQAPPHGRAIESATKAGAPAPQGGKAMELDLRNMQRPPPRALDVENPFR